MFPGYDERENTCYGKDRVIPRSQHQFNQMLDLADRYRSTDRITVASFNDWLVGLRRDASDIGKHPEKKTAYSGFALGSLLVTHPDAADVTK